MQCLSALGHVCLPQAFSLVFFGANRSHPKKALCDSFRLVAPLLLLAFLHFACATFTPASEWPCAHKKSETLLERKLLQPLLGTLVWYLGTYWNHYLEPLYLKPRNLPEPLLGTLTWNLAEPCGMTAPQCPRA